MYAIIQTGGKQLKVEAGQAIYVEKLANEAGEKVVFDKVVLVGGEKTVIGTPFVEGATASTHKARSSSTIHEGCYRCDQRIISGAFQND